MEFAINQILAQMQPLINGAQLKRLREALRTVLCGEQTAAGRNEQDLLAFVDMLSATGMRVGELVGLDIADVNFQERECIVTGKGNKQRPVYFDARTKLHLQAYLDSRVDNCPLYSSPLTGLYRA